MKLPSRPGSLAMWAVSRPVAACMAGMLLLVAAAVMAQPASAGLRNISARSSSGQFLALAKPYLRSSRQVLGVSSEPGFVKLDPHVLVISAERIRQTIGRELDITGAWQGMVYLRLRPADTADDVPVVSAEKFRDGWRYAVDLPEVVSRWQYMRAMTHVALLEYANRRMPDRSAELPAWLVEGVSAYLMLSSEAELILPAPEHGREGEALAMRIVQARIEHPLKTAQAALASRPAASFNELSWPESYRVTQADAEHYRLSALVFFNELLRLKDGRERLRSFLVELPQFRNWQMAFLRAYSPRFGRILDVEKWWALQAAHYEGRRQGDVWPVEESHLQLENALSCAVIVYGTTNALPTNTVVNLQTIVKEWKGSEQTAALRSKLAEFEMLRLRLSPELLPTLEGYRDAIRYFLVEKERIRAPRPHLEEAAYKKLVIDATRQLQKLDEARKAGRAAPVTAT